MTKWNNKKNTTLTFTIEANEDAKTFFERTQKELADCEEVFKQRIKQLFDEEIGVGGAMAGKAYEQVLRVFAIGYQHGWNDLCSLHKAHEEEE